MNDEALTAPTGETDRPRFLLIGPIFFILVVEGTVHLFAGLGAPVGDLAAGLTGPGPSYLLAGLNYIAAVALATGRRVGWIVALSLGGWNVAVSRYSPNPEAAVSLAMYMGGNEFQKQNALRLSHLPTIISLYDDAEIAEKQSLIPRWKDIFLSAVPRPSAPTKVAYNEVSSKFWTAVHDTLSGTGTAAENLEILELDLDELKGGGW